MAMRAQKPRPGYNSASSLKQLPGVIHQTSGSSDNILVANYDANTTTKYLTTLKISSTWSQHHDQTGDGRLSQNYIKTRAALEATESRPPTQRDKPRMVRQSNNACSLNSSLETKSTTTSSAAVWQARWNSAVNKQTSLTGEQLFKATTSTNQYLQTITRHYC